MPVVVRSPRSPALATLAVFFIAAGTLHFLKPDAYARIVPRWLPRPLWLVYISGACEIAGGIGVLAPLSRRFAGWGLIALLLAVFPANIQMVLDAFRADPRAAKTILLFLRLPIQAVLLAWVWYAALV